MNTNKIISFLLIAFGLVILIYSGISFTTPGETVNFLGLHIATTDHHFIPPVVGLISFVAGIILLITSQRSNN